jgi:hypothetical protein
MKNSLIFFLLFFLFIDCSPKMAVTKTKTVESEKEYINIPFKKIISPAFASENNGKWVQFKAKFSMLSPATSVALFPIEYRTKYVGLMIGDVDDPMAYAWQCAISKDKSDIAFELKQGDLIEIWAHLVTLVSGPPFIEIEKISKVVGN